MDLLVVRFDPIHFMYCRRINHAAYGAVWDGASVASRSPMASTRIVIHLPPANQASSTPTTANATLRGLSCSVKWCTHAPCLKPAAGSGGRGQRGTVPQAVLLLLTTMSSAPTAAGLLASCCAALSAAA